MEKSFLLQHLQLVHVLIQCTINSPHFRTLYIYTNFVSPRQMTPLHFAARQGHAGTAQLLVEKGADINVKDSDGVRE